LGCRFRSIAVQVLATLRKSCRLVLVYLFRSKSLCNRFSFALNFGVKEWLSFPADKQFWCWDFGRYWWRLRGGDRSYGADEVFNWFEFKDSCELPKRCFLLVRNENSVAAKVLDGDDYECFDSIFKLVGSPSFQCLAQRLDKKDTLETHCDSFVYASYKVGSERRLVWS